MNSDSNSTPRDCRTGPHNHRAIGADAEAKAHALLRRATPHGLPGGAWHSTCLTQRPEHVGTRGLPPQRRCARAFLTDGKIG